MANFTHTKFQQSPSSLVMIRKEILPSGYCVVFGVPLTFTSLLQHDIDFDAESDRILQDTKNTTQHRAFEHEEGGFAEVDTKAQSWFKFN